MYLGFKIRRGGNDRGGLFVDHGLAYHVGHALKQFLYKAGCVRGTVKRSEARPRIANHDFYNIPRRINSIFLE